MKLKSFILLLVLFLLNVACGLTNKEVKKAAKSFNDQLNLIADADGDGLSDVTEIELGTDVNSPDTDGDGLLDGEEVNTHRTNPLKEDTDDGGVTDGKEVENGSNPLDGADDSITLFTDADDDGLPDHLEVTYGTDPLNPDSDEDGLTDGAEVFTHFTRPDKKDTDEGGVHDGDEVFLGTNPLDKSDDEQPVQVVFETTPDSVTKNNYGEFQFSVINADRIANMMCALDYNEVENNLEECELGQIFGVDGLSEGIHRFSVHIITKNGVVVRAHYQWMVEANEYVACSPENTILVSKKVEFEPATNSCEWSNGENLAKKNVFVQARSLDRKSVALPEGATLCNVGMSAEQSIKFDDHMVLSMNGLALVTNASFLLSEQVTGEKLFDFAAVKGSRWGAEVPYCFVGNCSIPKHDKQATIRFFTSEAEGKILAQNLEGAESLDLEFSIIGDNDASDCKHTGLDIELEYSYSVPER